MLPHTRSRLRPGSLFRLAWLALFAGPLAAQFQLCEVRGSAANDRLGTGLAAVRNGAGTSLLFVGTPNGTVQGLPANTGTVEIRNSSCVMPPPFSFPLSSPASGDEYGARIASAAPNLVAIGAPGFDGPAGANTGVVRVLNVTMGGVVWSFVGGLAGERAGGGIAVGDVNGDRSPDFVVGSPGYGFSSSCPGASGWRTTGRTSVYSGADGSLLGRVEGDWHCSTRPTHPAEGDILEVLGDVDNDGRAEIVVGSPLWSGGRVHFLSYGTGTLVRYRVITGPTSFGSSLAALGDLDGDNAPDFAVGSPALRQVQLISGATGTVLPRAWTGVDAEFGATLANVGDQDGDGRPDLLIGAPGADGARGAAYVYSAHTGHLLAVLRGDEANERFGSSACAVPDWTGASTNAPEIAIGAPGASAGAGRAVVVTLAIDAQPAQAYWAPLGAPCAPAGTSGVLPRIGTPSGPPASGNLRFAVSVAETVPATQAFLFVGGAALPAPFCFDFVGMPTCCLQIQPWDAAIALPTLSPTTQLGPNAGFAALTIPISASIPAGIPFFAQAYVMDPGSIVFPGTMTAALRLVTR